MFWRQKILSLSQIQIPALTLTSCVDPAQFLTSLSFYFFTHKTRVISTSQGCYELGAGHVECACLSQMKV